MDWDDRDPTAHPNEDELIMEIDMQSEAYKQMREEAVDNLEEQIRQGDATRRESLEILVDSNILVRQMHVHIREIYKTIMTGAICLFLISGNLLLEFHRTSRLTVGIWGVFSLLLAMMAMQVTPPGTLKATLWENYETLYDATVGRVRS